MYAETKETVNSPTEIVYPLVRDEMVKIVPYIPNVDKIVELEREQISDTRLKILNHWYGKAEVPKIIKPFVKPELFQWKDFALWKDDETCVDFRIESFVANDLYDVSGTNYFIAKDGDKTEIKVTFNLDIYPEKLPGVPKFLGKRVKSTVEELVKRLLTPNLTSLAKGLNSYFAENG